MKEITLRTDMHDVTYVIDTEGSSVQTIVRPKGVKAEVGQEISPTDFLSIDSEHDLEPTNSVGGVIPGASKEMSEQDEHALVEDMQRRGDQIRRSRKMKKPQVQTIPDSVDHVMYLAAPTDNNEEQ